MTDRQVSLNAVIAAIEGEVESWLQVPMRGAMIRKLKAAVKALPDAVQRCPNCSIQFQKITNVDDYINNLPTGGE